MISRDEIAQLLSYDPATGVLTWLVPRNNNKVKAGSRAGTLKTTGYRTVQIGGIEHLEHRLIWFLMTGDWPSLSVDHQNGEPSDNRWDNLRLGTASQQQWNTKARKRSCGVSAKGTSQLSSGRWAAYIKVRKASVYLGSFDTEAEAAAAYAEAARAHFGEFARAS